MSPLHSTIARASTARPSSAAPVSLECYDALERLVQELPSCHDGTAQVLCGMETISKGARADLVFHHSPGREANTLHLQVGVPQSLVWCGLVADALLERVAGDQGTLLLPLLDGLPLPPPAPRSAALVRLRACE